MKYIILLALIFLSSCKTTEYITKIETKIDTVKIEKTIVDTVFHEKKIEVTKEVKANVFLPCPDDDKKGISGESKSGDNHAKWEYDSERKGYNVELYCAEQINRLDSINRRLTIENNAYKSSMSTTDSKKETVKENTSFWAKVMKEIWKVLFFVILALWLFGITPKFILKKVL